MASFGTGRRSHSLEILAVASYVSGFQFPAALAGTKIYHLWRDTNKVTISADWSACKPFGR